MATFSLVRIWSNDAIVILWSQKFVFNSIFSWKIWPTSDKENFSSLGQIIFLLCANHNFYIKTDCEKLFLPSQGGNVVHQQNSLDMWDFISIVNGRKFSLDESQLISHSYIWHQLQEKLLTKTGPDFVKYKDWFIGGCTHTWNIIEHCRVFWEIC